MMKYPDHAAQTATPVEATGADNHPQLRIVRSLAAIGMLLGAIGAVSLPMGLLRFHQGSFAGDARVNIFDESLQHPSFNGIWLVISSLSGAGLSLGLLIGSIGAILLRKWAIFVIRLWAIGSLIVGIAGLFFFPQWLYASWRHQLGQVREVVETLVNFGGWGIGIVFAVIILSFFNRPTVREVFDSNRQS